MRRWPIRLRLTLWYFFILAGSLLVFATFTLTALQHLVVHTLDRQLSVRAAAVSHIISQPENRALPRLRHDLDEDVELAPDITLMQVWDGSGTLLYRSPGIQLMHIPTQLPSVSGIPVTQQYHRRSFRILVQHVPVGTAEPTIMVALPMHQFAEAIEDLRSMFFIVIPLLLVFSAAAGYWIAGRALSPIARMIEVAGAIRPQDLSTRIETPPAADELQKLAATLNGMLDRLQQAFERITRFTADASHELRTPVALMRARTEILLRRPRSLNEYRTAHFENLTELENTTDLLEKLLLLARSDAGVETLHFGDLNLSLLTQSACDDMRALAETRSIQLHLEIRPEIWIRGDAAALRRLILILLDNAIKYSSPGGAVTVSAVHDSSQAIVSVTDNGIGIEPQMLPHIFDRFFRADPARNSEGSGLGLSIAQWITQAHGGSVTVSSIPGAGSTFRFVLPVIRIPDAGRLDSAESTASLPDTAQKAR